MEVDAERGKEVEKFLRRKGVFESEKEATKRERVLGILSNFANNFVLAVAQKNKIPIEKKYASKIFTFGSYRLGVHSSGADIDTLCVAPNFVSRQDFFTLFYDDLAEKEYVTDLTKVVNTMVPLIKFKIHSIPIDLLFARLDLPSIPPNIDLLDNRLLKHMDEKCILSLNGNRVTDEILASVPNVDVFHMTLRFIKYWAQTRCVYGHAYGYPGGVAYGICVAKVCQLHPGLSTLDTIGKFFNVFSQWPWPQPVIIKEAPDCNYNLKVWNPKINVSQRNDKMPVITPVYPSISSTHNVSISTLTVLKRDLSRCAAIFESLGKSEVSVETALEEICEETNFFTRHKNYFVVTLAGENKNEFIRFLGFAETRVRLLAAKLESIDNISFAYVFPKKYFLEESLLSRNKLLRDMKCSGEKYSFCAIFIGIEFSSAKLPINASRKMNLRKPVTEFKNAMGMYEFEEESTIVYDVFPMKTKDLPSVLDLFLGSAENDLDKEEKPVAEEKESSKKNSCAKIPTSGTDLYLNKPVSVEKTVEGARKRKYVLESTSKK